MAVPLLAVVGAIAPVTPAGAADVAPARAAVFTKGYDTAKVVTLSFDTDWRTGTPAENAQSARNVSTVRQLLARNGITAGFGMTGRYVQQNPGEARTIVAAGHKLINHSYSHPDFMTLTPGAALVAAGPGGVRLPRRGADVGGMVPHAVPLRVSRRRGQP